MGGRDLLMPGQQGVHDTVGEPALAGPGCGRACSMPRRMTRDDQERQGDDKRGHGGRPGVAGRRGSTSIQKQLGLLCIRSSSGSSTSGEPGSCPQRPRDSLFTAQTAVGRVVEQHSRASRRWAPRLTAVMPSKTGRPRTKLGTVCHVSRWAWTQSWTGDHRSWDTTRQGCSNPRR